MVVCIRHIGVIYLSSSSSNKNVVKDRIVSVLEPDNLPILCSVNHIVLHKAVPGLTTKINPPGRTAMALRWTIGIMDEIIPDYNMIITNKYAGTVIELLHHFVYLIVFNDQALFLIPSFMFLSIIRSEMTGIYS